MGNLYRQSPTIVSCLIVANLALCGFPFTAGFYSKDIIIESATNFYFSYPLLLISLFSLCLTSFYAIRSLLTPIYGPNTHSPFIPINEPTKISTPTLLLSIIAITAGAALT